MERDFIILRDAGPHFRGTLQVRTTLDQAGRKVEDGRGGRVGRVQPVTPKPRSGMANKEVDGRLKASPAST